MKKLLVACLCVIASACTATKTATFSYSGVFQIIYPLEFLSGSKVFSADELSIKTAEGGFVSAKVISNQSESLPEDFDIRAYPEYIFGSKEFSDKTSEIAQLFINTKMEVEFSYGISDVKIQNANGITRYSSCKERSCLAFVVKDSFPDHIFTIHSQGLDKAKFLTIVNGSAHVK